MIKRFFVTFVLTLCEDQDESCFVIKRQNTFMCFSTNKLRFLDIQNYLAPGVSYDKYLKAYGCSVQKGHFPYEYIDDLQKLEEHSLPPQAAFFSRLKNEGISDTDYALCQEAWRSNRMTTMRYFLVFYNNRDVVPFLECIDQQFAFYQQQNIDMFKDGISVPGLTLLYLFNDLPPYTFFTVFNQTNKDLHHLVKDNIVGGPAIIFHRYHEKNVTKMRAGETCRSVVGYDANALYLWALMQDMPCGWYTRRREEKRFQPQQAQPYGQMAAQWLTSVSHTTGRTIRHQSNGREKRVGKLLVDGWCAETRTAYQFHGCYFHGCTDCYEPQETNALNGKTMAKLLEDTKKNTAYLRRHVHVVEMWECEWKREAKPPCRPKWTITQNEILTAVIDGTLFGMVECDVRVPDNLRGHFAEMQPVFKNTTVTRDDIGPYMRQYAEEHNILTKPRRMLVGSYSGDKILLTIRHRSEWLPAECCDEHENDYVTASISGRPWTATEPCCLARKMYDKRTPGLPCCLARKMYDKRTPGLFKVEWYDDGFVGLCSKTYYCFGSTDKYSTKGLSKRQNVIDKDTFLAVLTNRRSGSGVNRGFRVRDSSVITYVQDRAALTYFYGKRKVLGDRVSTAPLEV